ncbi:MAG: divalent-cation tolerance protein CutA [Gemmatimonadota bacterium]|nr:divalent-cation tolerance protein CutA [Candidatus Palauibacterales bacterium]
MPDGNNVVVILVTVPDDETAAGIGRRLLEERLVACANIVSGLRSIYWWQGKLEDTDEVLMLLKAREEDVVRITARIHELHPYSVPEVIATRVVSGFAPYLEWVYKETDRSDADR